MAGREFMLVERNHFVGATAKYDSEGNIVQLAPDELLPENVVPNFQNREERLKRAAQCTCAIVGQATHDGKTETYTGTAFFIGPTTLVTAGHNAPTKHVRIVAQCPGTAEAAMNPFKVLDGSIDKCFKCTVVATLYSGEEQMDTDISILDCRKSYRAEKWLAIDPATDFKEGIGIDVMGYPGNYEVALSEDPEVSIPDEPRGRRFQLANEILPRWQLAISFGSVISGGTNPTYYLSTIGGMSGGPVLLNGKVVGEFS